MIYSYDIIHKDRNPIIIPSFSKQDFMGSKGSKGWRLQHRCCVIYVYLISSEIHKWHKRNYSQEDVNMFFWMFVSPYVVVAMSRTEDSISVNFSLAQRLSLNQLCSHSVFENMATYETWSWFLFSAWMTVRGGSSELPSLQTQHMLAVSTILAFCEAPCGGFYSTEAT